MDLLSLDLDVIHTILLLIRPFDALQLAMSCRTAYVTAIPYFLSEVILGGLDHGGPTQIVKFCAYMLADTSQRIPFLQTLRIECGAFRAHRDSAPFMWNVDYDYSSAALLAEVVQCATNLRKVDIDRAEYLFEAAPIFADALANRSYLHDVRLVNIGTATLGLLSRMVSRPSRIELDISDSFHDERSAKPSSLLKPGRDRLLDNFRHSLVSVKLSRRPSLLEELEPDTVWPAVQHLRLWGDVKSLSTFAHAFPNVYYLDLATPDVEDVVNLAVWSRLDHVVTRTPIPLSCPVRRLELQYDLEAVEETLYSMWYSGTISLLQRTSPVVLSCCPNMRILSSLGNTVLSVRFLEIIINRQCCSRLAKDEDKISWITAHLTALASSHLEALALHWFTTSESSTELELLRLAEHIGVCVPSLIHIGLDLTTLTGGWADHSYTWYTVTSRSEKKSPGLEKLAHWEGDMLEVRLLNTPRV